MEALDAFDLVDLDTVKRAHVHFVLAAVGGNRSLAARILGVDRKTLYRHLARSLPEPSHG
jgi:two-component system, NtrC family, response regulator AtoC